MVVKTELCAFSEYRIYPGHGMKFIRRDGQPITFASSKCRHMLNQRKKPAKLMWTQAWRRLNKKGKEEGTSKKRTKRTVKSQKAIVGASLEELKKKKLAKPQNVATQAALKEVKSNQKAKSAPAGGASNYAKPKKVSTAKAPAAKSNKTKAR